MEGRRENLEFIDRFPYDQFHESNTERIREFLLETLDWAERTLKKSDRILWWIKLAVIEVYNVYNDDPSKPSPVYEKWASINPRMSKYRETAMITGRFEEYLEHFTSSTYPKIMNYPFVHQSPDEIIEVLSTYEDEWRSKQKRKMKSDPSHTVVVQMGDFVWLNLNKAACKDESAAGGHCGNSTRANSGDRILSLRKITGENSQYYYATFVLEEDGYLGERKSYANNKPDAKLHPYIVELLKQPFIKGMKNGRFMVRNDFRIADLSGELADDLLKVRPDLFMLDDITERYGDNPDVLFHWLISTKIVNMGILGYYLYTMNRDVFSAEQHSKLQKHLYDEFMSMKPNNQVTLEALRRMVSEKLSYLTFERVFNMVQHISQGRNMLPLLVASAYFNGPLPHSNKEKLKIVSHIIENFRYMRTERMDEFFAVYKDSSEMHSYIDIDKNSKDALAHRYIKRCLDQNLKANARTDLLTAFRNGENIKNMTKQQALNILKFQDPVAPSGILGPEYIKNLMHYFSLDELNKLSERYQVNVSEEMRSSIRIALRRRERQK
jgi:hypothetical protein